MTLRAGLTLGLLALLAVFIVGAIITVVVQRGHLREQIDDQLESTPLPGIGPPGGAESRPGQIREEPVSDLYVAQIDDGGAITTVIVGQRLVDTPDLTGLLADPPTGDAFLTVDGVLGESTFRVGTCPPSASARSCSSLCPSTM